MSDQSKLGIGKIITAPQQRDAIHSAIAPVVAAHTLIAGRHVGLDQHGNATEHTGHQIGIVDPFLKVSIEKGQTFWLFLYPGTISSLRHDWTHPVFGAETRVIGDKEAAQKWVESYALQHCPYYKPNEAFARFMEEVNDGTIFYAGSDLHSLGDVEEAEELFQNLSVILGRPVAGHDFQYSCTC